MNTSFYNGISGSKTHQFGIDTWADNIANINTVGFKHSRPEFSTVFATINGSFPAVGGEPTANSYGYGVRVGASALDMDQGALQATDGDFDMALADEGWFGVQAYGDMYYTRAGSFTRDAEGFLVDPNGAYLMGTPTNNIEPTTFSAQQRAYYTNNPTMDLQENQIINNSPAYLSAPNAQEPIYLPTALYYPPVATTTVTLHDNLNPEVKTKSQKMPLDASDIALTIDAANGTFSIAGTSSNSALHHPAKGDRIDITLTDGHGDTNSYEAELDENLEWTLVDEALGLLDSSTTISATATIVTHQDVPNVQVYSDDVVGPNGEAWTMRSTYTQQVPYDQTSGAVWDTEVQLLEYAENYDETKTYDPNQYFVNGSKVYSILDTGSGTTVFDQSGQIVQHAPASVSYGDSTITIDSSDFTSHPALQPSRWAQSDGKYEEYLESYDIMNGNIVAVMSGGSVVDMAKIGVYHFQNDQGLMRAGGTLFEQSPNSGEAIFYTDENGEFIQNTKVVGGMLEMSNVDTSVALTELIVMQTGFDAAAKTITTSDEMIQNAIQMKK